MAVYVIRKRVAYEFAILNTYPYKTLIFRRRKIPTVAIRRIA